MSLKIRKYNTDRLLKLVREQYQTQLAYCDLMYEKYGVLQSRMKSNLAGYYHPSDDTISVMAKSLGLTIKEVEAIYSTGIKATVKKPIQKKVSQKATPINKKDQLVPVDVKKIKAAISDAGLTQRRVCDILDIAECTFSNWTRQGSAMKETVDRLARLLNVKMDDLLVDEPVLVNEEKSKPAVPKADSIPVNLTPIGDTQNVHEIFNIINQNIISLGQIVVGYIDYQIEENNKIQTAINELKGGVSSSTLKVDDLEMEISKEKTPTPVVNSTLDAVKSTPTPTQARVDEVKQLVKAFNFVDNYEAYNKKVNRMVGLIAVQKKATHKQILHKFYKQMNAVYGVVYDQLKKDFYERHHHKDHGSMELLYEDETFREIFYNIIGGELMSLYGVSLKD